MTLLVLYVSQDIFRALQAHQIAHFALQEHTTTSMEVLPAVVNNVVQDHMALLALLVLRIPHVLPAVLAHSL